MAKREDEERLCFIACLLACFQTGVSELLEMKPVAEEESSFQSCGSKAGSNLHLGGHFPGLSRRRPVQVNEEILVQQISSTAVATLHK